MFGVIAETEMMRRIEHLKIFLNNENRRALRNLCLLLSERQYKIANIKVNQPVILK